MNSNTTDKGKVERRGPMYHDPKAERRRSPFTEDSKPREKAASPFRDK